MHLTMKCPVKCRGQNSEDVIKEDDENVQRGNWSGKADFFLSAFGYAVGLGNIWRFPYLCYRNGGGAFLIPYIIFLMIIGWPMFFLETAYAQFSSLSPILAWRFCPLFKGVGVGMVVLCVLVSIYYNVIIAWSLFYMGASFTADLPWTTCNNTWNTDACIVRNRTDTLALNSGNVTNSTFDYLPNNVTVIDVLNTTNITFSLNMKRSSPSEEYWERYVLRRTSGIDELGGMRWELFACLLAAWVATGLCLIKGVKSSGKVVYVTAIFPCVVQIILLCRSVTLPGAIDGIKFYIIPEWHKLLELKVWADAALQIVYSNGAGWGGVPTMASYNKFHSNCYRQAVIVSALGSVFSIFSGFVVFATIGFLAYEVGSGVEDVVRQGPGLIFTVYPAVLARLPGGPAWSVIFFLMIFTVGLDSQFGTLETVFSNLIDCFPRLLSGVKKILMQTGLCFILFLFGIPLVMQGGVYALNLMDWYTTCFSVFIFYLIELGAISWIYGINQFMKDIELMIGYKPNFMWKVMWAGVTPAAALFSFLVSVIYHSEVTYGSYVYPGWAMVIGWFLAALSMAPVPIFMVKALLSSEGEVKDKLRESIQPTPKWGPALPEHRDEYIASLTGSRRKRILKRINADDNEKDIPLI